MKDIFKILKESTVLYCNVKTTSADYAEDLKKTCKNVIIVSSQDEALKLIKDNNPAINIIISDINLSSYIKYSAFYLLLDETIKTSEFLTIISNKISKQNTANRAMQAATTLSHMIKEEKVKTKQIATLASSTKNKLTILDLVVSELLVKFNISKDGIVSSTSKNFPEIFGFREEYIVNENISKIVHGSVLQKALLEVTRHKKPITEYLTFNTVTGIIIEPMVVIVPYFDSSQYLHTYSLYCTLQ